MVLKYFTDVDTKKSVAVNPNSVKCVMQTGYATKIIFDDGIVVNVEEDYKEVVAVLNEQFL